MVNVPHVAVLFYRIGPYHYARLKAAGSRLRVTAVEFSNVDLTYAWDLVEGSDGFDRLTLFSGTPVNELPANRIFKRVGEALDQLAPQVVAVPGWYDRCSLAAMRWCMARHVPVVVMSETTAWDDERKWWKEALKRRVVRLCSTGLVGGSPHAEYLQQLGLPQERIFLGYDAVDNAHFAAGADEVKRKKEEGVEGKVESGSRTTGQRDNETTGPSERQRSEVRVQYGLPDKYFLASARFVEKKNLTRLIQAYALYRKRAASGSRTTGQRDYETTGPSERQRSEVGGPVVSGLVVPWSLVLLGDGPLQSSIFDLRSSLGLEHFVHLPGFKQYDELPAYYGMASAFVHASSTEQWGLVVNEAMAAGLPVLVSNRCGCARDLVKDGVNGFTFDPFNVEQLASLMLRISAFQRFSISAFGSKSREIIANWGPARFADGLRQAVDTALRTAAPNPGLVDNFSVSALVHGFRSQPTDDSGKQVDGRAAGTGEDDHNFLVFRYQGRDVLAVPEKSKALLRAGLEKFQPFTPKRQLYRTLLSAAIRTGGSRLLARRRAGPIEPALNFDFKSWQRELEEHLGRRIAHPIVSWPSEPWRRRFYVHLLDEHLRSFAFVKLALRPEDRPRLAAQAEALAALSKLTFRQLRVPQLIRHDHFGPASYLVVQPLPTEARPPLLKQDWGTSVLTAEYCGLRRRMTRDEITGLSWWTEYIQSLRPEHRDFHEELTRLLASGAEVCRAHGDLALSNMVTDGSCTWLFDWELSHPDAPVLTDAVGFFMSFTVGKVPRDPAAQLAKFRAHFLPDDSAQRRLDIMLAIAFRNGCGVPDAGRLMAAWGGVSVGRCFGGPVDR
ncbi:MAG: glycosyltransferase [Verrucomicrobiota bacterium]|jgi:glycosyltransferase involved in cell wall biosynthesis